MVEKRLGVGIQGAGWVSGEHIKAFTKNPHTEVVAISSRTLEGARKKAQETALSGVNFYTSIDDLLADEKVDIVSICTPQQLHAEETVKAAEAGKHIVIEKPVATSLEGLKAMRDAVRKAKVKTVVSFVLRWNPLVETVKSLIADGVLGKIYYVECDYQSNLGDWWSGWHWAKKKENGVNSWLVSGVHAVDMARFMAAPGRYEAAKITEVYGLAGGLRKGKDVEYETLEVILVKFDTGALGKVSVNFECIQPYNFLWSVFGDRGTSKNNRIWSKAFPGQNDWIQIPAIAPDTAAVTHHPFQAEIDSFVNAILEDRECFLNLEDAVNTHEVAFAALKSEAENRPVKLPLI
ncbi:MAG: Gfo/Idh/MocA family oxidoreductase [Candidatus Bathyarchaeia archaeon]